MSILDKYPPPWTERDSDDHVEASNGESVTGMFDDVSLCTIVQDDAKPLILAAPELLAALKAVAKLGDEGKYETSDGGQLCEDYEIISARALIDRIEKP
jgi:hypothetical protein